MVSTTSIKTFQFLISFSHILLQCIIFNVIVFTRDTWWLSKLLFDILQPLQCHAIVIWQPRFILRPWNTNPVHFIVILDRVFNISYCYHFLFLFSRGYIKGDASSISQKRFRLELSSLIANWLLTEYVHAKCVCNLGIWAVYGLPMHVSLDIGSPDRPQTLSIARWSSRESMPMRTSTNGFLTGRERKMFLRYGHFELKSVQSYMHIIDYLICPVCSYFHVHAQQFETYWFCLECPDLSIEFIHCFLFGPALLLLFCSDVGI